MNAVWLVLIISGCVVALATGNVEALMSSVLEGAYDAVELVIGLTGIFCLWVGIERLANESGLIDALSRVTRPVLGPLFPYVKDEEKIMGAISATIISNILGLSSQTPLGLKAMAEIKRIHGESSEAIHSMITLVVISAAGFCIFPSGVIALRAALGSQNPAIVAGPTAVAGLVSTCAGLLAHRLFSKCLR
ncbi:MAG TPA: spore maturation protein [Firmicutes bacterium]|jgi:spore maturation protein A|nr:spore maturation protein [Bacillota bacterium]